MTVGRRILWSLLILVGVGVMLESLMYRFILLPSYESLERDEARQQNEHIVTELQCEVQQLCAFAADWGRWDDMCRFVQDRNPEFIKANLETVTFTKNHLSLLGIYDRSGHRVWFGAPGRDSAAALDLPEFPADGLPGDHPLLRLETVDSSTAGLIRTSAGPMLIASVPIVTSGNEGPIRGVVVMGRLLDSAFEQRLRDEQRIDLRLRPLPPGAPGRSGAFRFEPRGDVLRVSIVMPDLTGQPLLEVETAMPRRIMAQGYAATRLAVAFSAIASLALLLALAWLVRRFVVTPLGRVQRHAAAIRESADLSRRLETGTDDEIGLLGHEINLLLERIQAMTRDLDARVAARTADLEARKVELEAANASLRESRAAALNLMRDAVEAREQAEQANAALARSMGELRARSEELARFNRVAVGRELRMIQLKKEINQWRILAGQGARYPLAFEQEKK